MSDLVAVVVVRNGALPAGAEEAVAEAGGGVVLIGTDTTAASGQLSDTRSIVTVETREGRPGELAKILTHVAAVRDATGIILPASPDGRDLAPFLAHRLQRPLHASATLVRQRSVTTVRTAGRVGRELALSGPFVATLVPGIRGVSHQRSGAVGAPTVEHIDCPAEPDGTRVTVHSIEVLPPDPATMDLTEAPCIVGGGLGLATKERFDQLGRIGTRLGASLGGTRVASDAGWIPFERQIGTTGVAVKPSIYLAFGISGATQHTSGLGDPDHIICVNTDPSCPMMTMADVAILSDARGVLDALERRLTQSE